MDVEYDRMWKIRRARRFSPGSDVSPSRGAERDSKGPSFTVNYFGLHAHTVEIK